VCGLGGCTMDISEPGGFFFFFLVFVKYSRRVIKFGSKQNIHWHKHLARYITTILSVLWLDMYMLNFCKSISSYTR
jgi:hypothetical protein